MKDVKQIVSARSPLTQFGSILREFPRSRHHTNTDHDTILTVRHSECCLCLIHDDGQGFGFARLVIRIDEYHGTRPIASLSVYPLQHHDDNDGVYSRAGPGKRLLQLPTHSFREISGRTSRQIDLDSTVRLFFEIPSIPVLTKAKSEQRTQWSSG